MSVSSRTSSGCLPLVCLAQGRASSDAPAPNAGREREEAHAGPESPLSRWSDDLDEYRARAAQDAADAAQELDGDELTASTAGAGGAVKCWGRSSFGQLGYGATGDRLAPPAATVPLGAVTVTALAAGVSHTCARLRTGNFMCWGRSNAGQLGYGNTSNIGDGEPPSAAGTVPFLD